MKLKTDNLIPNPKKGLRPGISKVLASLTCASILVSCGMVNEDLPPCAVAPNTITRVSFVYDYNIQREDLFNEHVGTAHLYVFDEDSIFLFDRSLSRTDMPGLDVDFTMEFDTTYIKPDRKYFLVAMAQGNHAGYEASLETPGFQVPLQYEMIPGVSKLSSYRVMLDRDSDSYADLGIVNYKDAYGNNREMIDTLWSTRPGQIQKVEIPMVEYPQQVQPFETQYVDITIPMMRITNSITVNLVHSSFNENTNPDRYVTLIDFPNGNGTISFTGETFPNRELLYRSIRKEMSAYNQNAPGASYNTGTKAATTASYAIQATFGVSRLQTTDGSSLQIREAGTNEIIFQLGSVNGKSLSDYLAEYFNSSGFNGQDLLDRQYNFTIDIHMSDDMTWDWYQIGCEILGWGKRVFSYDIK